MKITLGCLSAAVLAGFGFVSTPHAFPSYIGFSGAPGSSGRCAATCHGSAGGTIQIAGFPAEYAEGGVYTITISHSAGSSIKNFNGSCRIGVGSQNAGVIAAGTNTATYNTGVETNGIRLSANDRDTGTFSWTAPAAGTGEVRLYIAGHQGSYSGPNTTLVLVATEQVSDAADEHPAGLPTEWTLGENYPNPFGSRTAIPFAMPVPARVRLEIFDLAGGMVDSFELEETAGRHEVLWTPDRLPSGIYLCRLQAPGQALTRKMIHFR